MRKYIAIFVAVSVLTVASPAEAASTRHVLRVAQHAILRVARALQRRGLHPVHYHVHCGRVAAHRFGCRYRIRFRSGAVCHSTLEVHEPGDRVRFGHAHCA